MPKQEDAKTLEQRIAELEQQVEELRNHGGMLSIVDLRCRIVKPDKVDNYLQLFKKRDWPGIKQIGKKEGEQYEKKFVITEYNELNLTPFSYDLSVGHQLFSIQRASAGVVSITDEHPYILQPRETVVVITRELIAIPPCYSATVWPRFNMVRSGILQSMVKIDPTWYGKLAVAMSNLSPTALKIEKGKAFGTFLLYELSRPSDVDLWKEEDLEEVDLAFDNEIKSFREKLIDFIFASETLRGHCRVKGDVLKIKGIKRRELVLQRE